MVHEVHEPQLARPTTAMSTPVRNSSSSLSIASPSSPVLPRARQNRTSAPSRSASRAPSSLPPAQGPPQDVDAEADALAGERPGVRTAAAAVGQRRERRI